MKTVAEILQPYPGLIELYYEAQYVYVDHRQHVLTPYHNYRHALNVAEALIELGYTSPAVIIAALYHDVVYFPGAGSDANERCSSTLLASIAREVNRNDPFTDFEKEAINTAQNYIEQTDVETHIQLTYDMGDHQPEDLNALLDADLSSFAADWEVFTKNQLKILAENGIVDPQPEDLDKSARFLSMFVNQKRKRIYRTKAAQALWEDKATENIFKWIELHRKK